MLRLNNQLSSAQGFTLVELSIVLVIIGLVVAGVVAGQALVNQAKLQKIVSDVGTFKTAFNQFRIQYGNRTYPGDMPNATSFWPGCNSGAAANDCNGDGNGKIAGGTFPNDLENLREWQHLNLAVILPGSYTGVGVGGGMGVDITNSPSGLRGGIFAVWNLSTATHWLYFGKTHPLVDASEGKPYDAIMNVKEVVNIDTKTDDGIYNNGKARAATGLDAPANSCVLANLGDSTLRCYMIWTNLID